MTDVRSQITEVRKQTAEGEKLRRWEGENGSRKEECGRQKNEDIVGAVFNRD